MTFERALFDWLTQIVAAAGGDSPLAGWQVCASDYEEPDDLKPGVLMVAAGVSQPRPQSSGAVREFNARTTVILLSPVERKEESEQWAVARDRVIAAGLELTRILYQEQENRLGGFTCAAQAEGDLLRSFLNFKGQPWAVANLPVIANEMRMGARSRQDFVEH